MIPEDTHHRKSIRVDLSKQKQKILYKFISPNKTFVCNEIFKGQVLDLSECGARICGTLPSLRLMNQLGDEKIYIGCVLSVFDYSEDEPKDSIIKMLSRIRWAKSDFQMGTNYHSMGLEFTKITESDRRSLKNYLIHQQLRTTKINRSLEMLNPDN